MTNRIVFNEMSNFNELVKNTMGLIDQTKLNKDKDNFLPTYFAELDQKIGGLERGKITAIVGRPSMWKTLFAMNIVRNIVNTGKPVFVISLSLCKEDWTRCFISSSANIDDLHKTRVGFLNEEEIKRLHETAQKVSSLPIYVKDENRRLEDIFKTLSDSIKELKIELVLIDGISNIYGNTIQNAKGRGQRYDKQLRLLKEMATQWNIPVLITQGLSRRIERNPYLLIPKHEYGLKEGYLSVHASRILQLYREEYYNPKKRNRGVMDIRIPAMGYGECDSSIKVHFDRSSGVVKEYPSMPFNPKME
ncbi:MAG: AAA family ATPase [Candidatus Omnitrophica bacterium]|nr:AAA family ATPase [Candidatus Omnitrophota bacterium]